MLRGICRYHALSLRLSRLRVLYFPLLLLAALVPGSAATSCQFPCDPASQCNGINTSNCEYGIVKDVCECCDVCGKPPGGYCGGGFGKCGNGLVCVQGFEEGLSEQELREYPSICELAPSTSKHACKRLMSCTADCCVM